MTAETIAQDVISAYEQKFPVSGALHKECLAYMPGGCTRSLSYFRPFPIHLQYGKGAYVYTHEGHKLLDVTNAYGALIHGHCDPDVSREVMVAIEKGTQFAAPTDSQYALSKLLCERVESIERVRFCNSGSEATLFALRTARAITNRSKILKMSGGFHGTHDCVATSTNKNAVTKGIPPAMTQDVIEVPFNDYELLASEVAKNKSDLAAVIVEPFLGAGGIISPADGYLQFIRDITKKNDVLLIFDEIFSLRIASGGAQAFYGVYPDMTTVGKIIGGGFPIGAFGGRKDIMDIYCHAQTSKPLYHSGTFNGFEVAMKAGLAALQKCDQEELQRLNALGSMLFNKIARICSDRGLSIQINQIGSVLNIHFVKQPVTNSEIAAQSEEELLSLLHLSLLVQGIYATPRGLFILSTAMTEDDIENISDGVDSTLMELMPLIRKKYPHLLI